MQSKESTLSEDNVKLRKAFGPEPVEDHSLNLLPQLLAPEDQCC